MRPLLEYYNPKGCNGAGWTWTLYVAWYDIWVGVFWSRRKRRIYIHLIPCVGVSVTFGRGPRPVGESG